MDKKEKKDGGLGWSNVNGISADDDRSCALNDMNCREGQEGDFSYSDMNSKSKDEDTSCSLNDMNCEGK